MAELLPCSTPLVPPLPRPSSTRDQGHNQGHGKVLVITEGENDHPVQPKTHVYPTEWQDTPENVWVPGVLSWNMHEKHEKNRASLGAPLQRGWGWERGTKSPPPNEIKFSGAQMHQPTPFPPSPPPPIPALLRVLARRSEPVHSVQGASVPICACTALRHVRVSEVQIGGILRQGQRARCRLYYRAVPRQLVAVKGHGCPSSLPLLRSSS